MNGAVCQLVSLTVSILGSQDIVRVFLINALVISIEQNVQNVFTLGTLMNSQKLLQFVNNKTDLPVLPNLIVSQQVPFQNSILNFFFIFFNDFVFIMSLTQNVM